MSWAVLSYGDSQQLAAWADQMSQAGYRTMLSNFAYTIQGSGSGSPTVNGGGQTGKQLVTNGWTHSATNVLMIGDLFNVYAGTITFTTAPVSGHALTFHDYYGNSYSIGMGDGTTKAFNLPNTFFTGYKVFDNGTLTTAYTATMQHQLLRVVATNVSSDSSGDATINIEPALRFSPVSGNSIVLTNPGAAFAFAKPGSSLSYTAPRIAALSLSLEEDITV